MDIVLFGIQGSGKGTQGKYLTERYNLALFETGGELRRLAQENSPLGQKIKSIIEAGHLVPTEVVMEMIENFLSQLPQGSNVLFDGIPRKEDQAQAFDEIMNEQGRNFMGVLIELSKEEAMNRLTTRRLCPVCKTVYPKAYTQDTCEKDGNTLITRQDDNPESIQNRLDTYFQETTPIIQGYSSKNKMLKIKGDQSIEDVTKDLFEALDQYFQ